MQVGFETVRGRDVGLERTGMYSQRVSNASWIIRFMFVLFFSPSVHAWNGVGHQVVAEIAWQHLTPEAKAMVTQDLHYLEKAYPRIHTFRQLASWPDQLSVRDVRAFGTWHYVDLPSNDPAKAKLAINAPDHVVWAITVAEEVLKNRKATRFEKGWFLGFLVHCVGDVHQPLHAIDRISKAHPDGDRGGNDFPVKSAYANNLHSLWDKGLGLLISAKRVPQLAASIQAAYPPASLPIKSLDPSDWAWESYLLANQQVYDISPESKPSPRYLKEGKILVRKRLALAGYRLAALLNHL